MTANEAAWEGPAYEYGVTWGPEIVNCMVTRDDLAECRRRLFDAVAEDEHAGKRLRHEIGRTIGVLSRAIRRFRVTQDATNEAIDELRGEPR